MTNYDVVTENMETHGPIVHFFKMLAMKNAKKLELRLFLNQPKYITELKYLPQILCFECDISIDALARNNLLFIKDLKIRNGCQNWMLINQFHRWGLP